MKYNYSTPQLTVIGVEATDHMLTGSNSPQEQDDSLILNWGDPLDIFDADEAID